MFFAQPSCRTLRCVTRGPRGAGSPAPSPCCHSVASHAVEALVFAHQQGSEATVAAAKAENQRRALRRGRQRVSEGPLEARSPRNLEKNRLLGPTPNLE
jgi:hypothetical protein